MNEGYNKAPKVILNGGPADGMEIDSIGCYFLYHHYLGESGVEIHWYCRKAKGPRWSQEVTNNGHLWIYYGLGNYDTPFILPGESEHLEE